MRLYILDKSANDSNLQLPSHLIQLIMHVMLMRLTQFYPEVEEDNIPAYEAISTFERAQKTKIETEGWDITMDNFQLRPFLKYLWLCGNSEIMPALESLTRISEYVERVHREEITLKDVPSTIRWGVEQEVIMFGICGKSWAAYLNSVSARLKLDFKVGDSQ